MNEGSGLRTPEDSAPQRLATGGFGDLMVASNTPIVQFQFIHWLPARTFTLTTLSATVTRNTQSELEVSTGTTANSVAVFRSLRSVIYRPGEGNMARYTARFETGGVASSTQFAGFQSTTDGLGFGFDGTSFGIRHRFGGEREVRSLQITGSAGGSENATVNVNGTAYVVPLTSGTVQHNANEVFEFLTANDLFGEYEQVDDTVVYLARLSEAQSATFSFSSSSATGTWSSIQSGNAPTDTWIAQASWNGVTPPNFDPTKGNVYQVQYQFLGYGDMEFFIEDGATGQFVLAHRILYAGANTRPSLNDPSMYLAVVANSDGSTTDIKVFSSSLAAFRQGEQVLTTLGRSKSNLKNISTTQTNLLTIKCRVQAGGRGNHGELLPKLISVATESGKTTTLEVSVNSTLGGSPNFQYIEEGGSIALYDTAGTTVTGGTVIETIEISGVGSDDFDVSEILDSLVEGEQVTISAALSQNPASDVSAAISWKENI